MIVGAAAADFVTEFGEGGGQGRGVLHDARRVLLELRPQRFAEANGLGRDDVHERAALGSRKNHAVYLLRVLRLAENESAARAAQALVRGGGHEIGIRHRVGMLSASDESGDVGHVHEEQCANAFRDLRHAREINDARIGAGTGGDHLWLHFRGFGGEFIVINPSVLLTDAVGMDRVELARKIRGVSVGEVTAVGEVHGENGIAEFQ